jgi:hypothetical protein
MADIDIVREPGKKLEQRFSEPREVALLWYGFLGGMLAWKLQLMVAYALVPYACWHDLTITIHVASLLFFLMAVSAAWLSWGTWKEVGGHPLSEGGYDETVSATVGRTRFMAVAGVIMGSFSALVILAQWIPNLILSPCHGLS